jgi:hypothetical protein
LNCETRKLPVTTKCTRPKAAGQGCHPI